MFQHALQMVKPTFLALPMCRLRTDSCLNAITPLIAQRANRVQSSVTASQILWELNQSLQITLQCNKEAIEENFIQRRIRWKLNQLAAPHFGGLWEGLVESCKRAFYVVLETDLPTRTLFQ